MKGCIALGVVCALAASAAADDEEDVVTPPLQIHGFVTEGGFWSTANDYIGRSSRGSLELLEAAINVSSELSDRLHVGVQIFSRVVGAYHDPPHLDWAVADYQWQPWLGLRAGMTKMPFGLYNESMDVDAAHLPILLPQSVYPLQNRDVLRSQIGFALYGTANLCRGGELDYQAWFGTLTIPENALTLMGATLDSVDTKYVTGAQLLWSPPVDGLRVGAAGLRTSIDFHLTLDPRIVEQLIMAGLVPADYDGALVISQRPVMAGVASAEYTHGGWLVAAEYSRWLTHQQSTLPMLLQSFDRDAERFYAMTSYRLSDRLEAGVYYSVSHADASDRTGRDRMQFARRYYAFQRDLAASVQLDVNERWLWKLEGHFVDGTADLQPTTNPDPVRYWGLFLIRTTVSF